MAKEALDEILGKIARPLQFSIEEDFKQLPRLKDVEPLMRALTAELENTSPEAKDLAQQLATLFSGFDGEEMEEKKHRLVSAQELLHHFRQRLPLPPATAGEGSRVENMIALLSQPIQYVKGVGPRIASLFEKKRVSTVEDLLYFLPRKYEDRRTVKAIAETAEGMRETIVGNITVAQFRGYGATKAFEVIVTDASGQLIATWFKGSSLYLKNTFKVGHKVILTGEVRNFKGMKSMIHPDFEVMSEGDDDSLHFRRIVPIYSESEGLHQKTIRRIVHRALSSILPVLESPIPPEICAERELPLLTDSLQQLHFPTTMDMVNDIEAGRSPYLRRLIYEEFFFLSWVWPCDVPR